MRYLYDKMPQLIGKVDYFEISTPLSTDHFCAYLQGELYGLDHDPTRLKQNWLGPRTRFEWLWLTGQDVLTCGRNRRNDGRALLTTTAIVGPRRIAPLLKRIYS